MTELVFLPTMMSFVIAEMMRFSSKHEDIFLMNEMQNINLSPWTEHGGL